MMAAHEPLERLERRLAQWRVAQVSGPNWMRASAGNIIKDLQAEIAARRKEQAKSAEG